jgi:hypothetical protein
MSDRNQVDALIQGYQRVDPRLYDILRTLSAQIRTIRSTINATTTPEAAALEDPTLNLPSFFTYSLPGNNVTLSWSGTDSSGTVLSAMFEIRKGTNWETASFITRTSSLSATLPPDLTVGTHVYLLKTIGFTGKYSVNSLTLYVTISPIPQVVVTSNVIDNNILLYWSEPVSHQFNIVKYEIFRNGVSVGFQFGTFAALFENAGGTFEYSVIAYDLAGNTSLPYILNVKVNQPPDFELVSKLTSTFTGTTIHCVVEAGVLLATTSNDTWQSHFATEGWDSIQDQLDAGYPIYLQPAWMAP